MLKPASPSAMSLLMEGAICFARMEAAGLRIDTAYLDSAISSTQQQVADMEKRLRSSEEHKAWAKRFGNKMKLDSPAQLGKVIFDTLGHPRNPNIELRTGRKGNDVVAFEHLKLPFLKDYFDVRRLRKALSTNLLGIRREVVSGYLHPFLDLHTAESYRSSSSRPNFHNQPTRNKDIARIVRACVVPRKGNIFIEADYSSQEVRVSACYNKDPKLIEYVTGGGDMHRDLALRLFCMTPEEMGPFKDKTDAGAMVRYIAKNKYVFAQFYGSYYGQCAPDLWDAVTLYDLKTGDGTSMLKHLRRKGIRKLGLCDPQHEPVEGTFEHHVQKVERWMWREMFPVYDQWKKDWWALYQSQGGVNTLTGFKMDGVFRRNQILCDPIQGSAFHCLLWTAIRVQNEFIKRKMKSKVVLQIHDSMLIDTYPPELEAVVEIVQHYGVHQIAQEWVWLIVPLQVEFEICESNWADKKPLAV